MSRVRLLAILRHVDSMPWPFSAERFARVEDAIVRALGRAHSCWSQPSLSWSLQPHRDGALMRE